MGLRNFIFNHIEKIILCIAACYLVYTIIHTFGIQNSRMHNAGTRVLSLSDNIDARLKTSTPPLFDATLRSAEQMELRFTTPPFASLLQRTQIFSKFSKEGYSEAIAKKSFKNQGSQTAGHVEIENTSLGDMEFIFKGGTSDTVLVQVRKLHKNNWMTSSFVVEKGKCIGEVRTIRGEAINFDTQCRLIEIIPAAQKPVFTKNTLALLDEKGKFIGTSIIEETYMISTSKITFKTPKEKSYDLWIGELANLGTDTVTVRTKINYN